MRVVFAGGGTGGHIYPGVAVARALQRMRDDVQVEFWGGGRPLERAILEKQGFPYRALPAAPLPRGPLAVPRFLYSVAAGYLRSRKLLKRLDVAAAVGLGGYSSFAPVLAAAQLGLPTLLLEQNAVVGKANLRLARRASLVCLTWEESLCLLSPGARAEVTGNPLRRDIVTAASQATYSAAGALVVLGGSTGAVGLNTAVISSLPTLAALSRPILHQTGEADLERVRAAYGAAGVKAEVVAFVDDMAGVYSRASLVIARAGGTTLSEVALFGIPAILVPYPHHRDRHQRANAEIFARRGAAEIIEEADTAALAALLEKIVSVPGRLESMHAEALALARPEAADVVAGRLVELVEKHQRG